ncbi:transporter [Pseudoxanthomonas broegbernensis]|uniref:Transporter n=1 Tax=Pseudoxanthomonas broegbernensis TaxID=83619 RepID=A0A7V8GN67_9GAMM|nr:EamA family transporter [Pseudoxanthomonas broegbernensis]KAF1686938.1 transporter [Pseudoxanthomonas broegbernensis]MBB6065460.1 transporter family protein [Pseudoxanthomonas broegbernensis]
MNIALPAWLAWAALSACFAALTAVFAKAGVRDVDSDLAMALRTIMVALLVVPFVVATGKWADPFALPTRAQAFLVLSALATGASWLCYFRAIQVGELTKVALVDKTSVLLVLLFAVVFLGEKPSGRDWLGILLVLSGLAMLTFRR